MTSIPYTLVLGLGITGASVVRHLVLKGAGHGARNERVVVMDSRDQPPFADEIAAAHPEVEQRLGAFAGSVLDGASCIVASPGIAGLDELTANARARGVPVLSDIDLFARAANAPVIGITGTNGKSTVTVLLGELLAAAGIRVAVGGNLGTPALALLDAGVQCYVLELSSFQLDITHELHCLAATVLNVSPDHLDRYGDMPTYARSKRRIYQGTKYCVFNRADAATRPPAAHAGAVSFGLDAPGEGQFGIAEVQGVRHLMHGNRALVPANALQLRGTHNETNVLAALALAHVFGVAMPSVLPALRTFAGLPHRCQSVATLNGVEFINDSKATNEGAALAALAGVGDAIAGRIVLIAGGDGKGSDFADLAAALPGPVRAVVTIGRDAERITRAVAGKVPVVAAGVLRRAVRMGFDLAQAGDCVLLAPACASLDQFLSFEQRGDCFAQAVTELVREIGA